MQKDTDRLQKEESLDYLKYLFHEGTCTKAYEFLGAHFDQDGEEGPVTFRCWAPNAREVSVVGDFNHWDVSAHKMTKIDDSVWEAQVAWLHQYDNYKFAVTGRDGTVRMKADPYAFHAQTRPETASKVYQLNGYEWKDQAWLDSRSKNLVYHSPMNIYEMNMGSWRQYQDGAFFSYGKLAEELVPYVKEMGYTHIEIMPIMEFPYDGSWGYQVTGYFAPTSRYGTPHDFMGFVDACHQAGIGVIMDWVPAHFPKDAHGLYEFDGGACYEYSDPLKMEHPDWGTRIFDYGKNEVRSFLMSSAMHWIENYHIDGLRVDAVASMLYLDYGKNAGQWRPNKYGGNQNLEAVEFLQGLNERIFAEHPDVLMVAEESTAWPGVTKPVFMDGLGFNLKWNMGWMNDMLHYVGLDPYFRQFNHKDITFSFMYAFSENYVLPISHDEVVHGKKSLLDKFPGTYEEKFAGLRCFMTYMMCHPGKKLIFMGAELGQFMEWNEKKELDWNLLDYESHRKLQYFFKTLNHLYLSKTSLWKKDFEGDGFDWICHDDAQANTVIFRRRDGEGKQIIMACNFSPIYHRGYKFGVPLPGVYHEVFNSDQIEFGGEGRLNGNLQAKEGESHGKPYYLEAMIPPFSAVLFEPEKSEKDMQRKPAKAKTETKTVAAGKKTVRAQKTVKTSRTKTSKTSNKKPE